MLDYKVIYVHLKISLILKFIHHAWFEMKLENDCLVFFVCLFQHIETFGSSPPNELELCNSPCSRKTFLKGPTPLLGHRFKAAFKQIVNGLYCRGGISSIHPGKGDTIYGLFF